MQPLHTSRILQPCATLTCLAASVLFAHDAVAQSFEFSLDWRGPTIGVHDAHASEPITEGTILRPATLTPTFGPLGAPRKVLGTSELGLLPGCAGHPGGTPCHVEVDALSHGRDDRFAPHHVRAGAVRFSTDEYASGFPGLHAAPDAASEGPVADLAGDVLVNLDSFAPALVGAHEHTSMTDGDGSTSPSGYVRPGLGIVEPRSLLYTPHNDGDNVDAIDIEPLPLAAFERTYFSLDSALHDPFNFLVGTGSAAAHGFVGGDVLVAAGGVLSLYAPAAALGLDLVAGPDSDDLDALIVWENMTPGFQPAFMPFAWETATVDMLVFSVRRGSAVVGHPDSRFGIPISEGDLLSVPKAGGHSPFPAIIIPAESLGLATMRSGISLRNDELDAADHEEASYFDCNGNGVEDALELAGASLFDSNGNGVLDTCETSTAVGSQYCTCTTGAPCGNTYVFGGCANSSGVGAILSGYGNTSLALDSLVLETTQMSPGTFALTFRGSSVSIPLVRGDGLACVGGLVYRMPPYATGAGTASVGPGLAALTRAINPASGWIVAGSTWKFQTWYRTSGGCGGSSSMSNALAVTFTP